MGDLSHFDESGASRMVDVTGQGREPAHGEGEWPGAIAG